MTRKMYDSTEPTLIPDDAQIVAYYPHAWSTNLAGHEHAIIVSIDNHGDHADDCHILDVETGAASNTTAVEWVQSWHKLHPNGLDCVNGWIRKPVLYTSTSNLPALNGACHGLDYDIWAAQWDGTMQPVAGCFAKQYIDHGPNGENYDMSSVYDDTWGVKPVLTHPVPANQPFPSAQAITGLVTWTDDAWNAHARLVTSHDGGKSWA